LAYAFERYRVCYGEEFDSIMADAEELIKMLVSIVKTTKARLGK